MYLPSGIYLPALQDEIHILLQQSLTPQFTIGAYHISSKFWRKCDMSSFGLFLLLFFFVLYCTPWPDARPFTEGKKMKRKCNFHLEKSRKGGSCINNSFMELNQCYVHSLKRACELFAYSSSILAMIHSSLISVFMKLCF